jgi:hypothetical protein
MQGRLLPALFICGAKLRFLADRADRMCCHVRGNPGAPAGLNDAGSTLPTYH